MMKKEYIKVFVASILSVLLSSIAYGQSRLLLGPAEPQPMQKTPRGINVQTNSFDYVWKKRIRRTVNWMMDTGQDNLVGEFLEVANNTPAMLDQIDEIWHERVTSLSACGGKWAGARNLDPRRITLTVEAEPFSVPYYGPTERFAGVTDGDHIRVVVAHVNSHGLFLQHYRNLFKWEASNYIACKLGMCPKNLDDEGMVQNPCGR